jgi:hypothetical protein
MSEKRTAGLTPFTKDTAPRNGRPPGARNKINARAWKVIDTLLTDYKEHGDKVVTALRIEKPYEYVHAGPAGRQRAGADFHQPVFS